ncbi:hypothetical protein SAMN04487923_10896, partial [Phocaeicola vulgatus]
MIEVYYPYLQFEILTDNVRQRSAYSVGLLFVIKFSFIHFFTFFVTNDIGETPEL